MDRLTLSSTLVLASEEISPVHELYVRESKTVLDSAFHAVKFRIPGTGSQSLSVELGLRIAIVCGVPDSKAQDFGFHKQFFFFKDFGFHKQKFRIPLHEAINPTHHSTVI